MKPLIQSKRRVDGEYKSRPQITLGNRRHFGGLRLVDKRFANGVLGVQGKVARKSVTALDSERLPANLKRAEWLWRDCQHWWPGECVGVKAETVFRRKSAVVPSNSKESRLVLRSQTCRPVLKHGPRSLTCMQVRYCVKVVGEMKVKSLCRRYLSPVGQSKSMCVGTRKMVNYA